MSSWQCTVCNRYDDNCACETVSRARWDAAKNAWLSLRTMYMLDAPELDAMFFEGETAKAPATLTITGATSE